MVMRTRLHRLQEIYQSLGKEPNAKGKVLHNFSTLALIKCAIILEIEIKAMISDFDKVGRK